MRIVLWIVGILAAAALGFYAYMGGFQSVVVTKTAFGPVEFVNAKHLGSYSKLNETWGAFMPKWQEANLGTCLTMGVYLDPPGTPDDKLRSLIGCRIDGWTDEQKAAARAKFPALTIPQSQAYTTKFPFRNFLSFFFAPTRAYPAIDKQMAADGVTAKGPVAMEFYGSFENITEIEFVIPVGTDAAQYQPLIDVFAG